jgi:hypothetical protein
MSEDRSGGFLSLLPTGDDEDHETSPGKSKLATRVLSKVPVQTPPMHMSRNKQAVAVKPASPKKSPRRGTPTSKASHWASVQAKIAEKAKLLGSDSDSDDDDHKMSEETMASLSKDPGAMSKKIRQLTASGRYRDAAWTGIEALRDIPGNPELGQLVDESLECVRKFPRFQESLAVVSLTGPSGTAVIGNHLLVAYKYSHMTPVTEVKRFAPLSRAIRDKVKKHDSCLLRNTKLPSDRSLHAVAAEMSSREEQAGDTVTKKPYMLSGLPSKRPDLGEGWSEEEEKVLRDVYDSMKKNGARVPDMCAAVKGKLREELQHDVPAMLRMLKLYDSMQSGERLCVCVCTSMCVHVCVCVCVCVQVYGCVFVYVYACVRMDWPCFVC